MTTFAVRSKLGLGTGPLAGLFEPVSADGAEATIARAWELGVRHFDTAPLYADGGGELLVCPICFNARKLDEGSLVANARLAGATPLWEWIGDEHATVFSY